MMQLITASENLPFTVALTVMFGIALLEGITSVFGAGISAVLDTLLPDTNLDMEVDSSEMRTPNVLTRLLGWLRVGQVPILMLLVIFLTAFGLIGLGIQSLSQLILGNYAPGWLASIPAAAFALPTVRFCGGLLERFMPKDETEAVSEDSFVGRVAIVTLGTAEKDSPAQAKLKDRFGQSHYIMVEPESNEEKFVQGENVLLIQKVGSVFQAIKNTNEALTDKPLKEE
ncbi:MAG: YqiJ family protein [Gammaproteobacteria bacterium]|nr:YqiJ family protein [Gammaproteobacteria bacterium]